MSEPELIQRQREILRTIRPVVARRVQAEAEAEAVLNKTQEQAKAQLDKINDKLKAAKEILKERGQQQALVDSRARPTTGFQGADPAQEIKRCVSTAHHSLEGLKKSKILGCLMSVLVYWGAMFIIAPIVAIGYFVCFALIPKSDTGETLAWLCLLGAGAVVVFGPALVVLNRDREQLARAKRCSRTLAQAVADAEFWYKRWLAQAQARYRQTMGNIAQTFRQEMARMRPTLADFTSSVNSLSPLWTDPAWRDWTPAATAPSVTRLGELRVGIHQDRFPLPAFLSFPGDRSLLFETVGLAEATVVQTIQSLLLRLLATIPPGKLRFTFLDAVGLGQNVAPFMHLADYDEALVTGKAWTESRHIEQRLADLTEHMENVIQKYLRDQFATIEEYNAQAGEMAEPYRVLVVLDFPVNFSEAAARRLVSIVQNGPRCGVYAVILVDTEKPLPYGFNQPTWNESLRL